VGVWLDVGVSVQVSVFSQIPPGRFQAPVSVVVVVLVVVPFGRMIAGRRRL